MLAIRIVNLPNGTNYTALSGASGAMLFQFDKETGDDSKALAVDLGDWDRDDIMLEHMTV
jgi:hypothetical protein